MEYKYFAMKCYSIENAFSDVEMNMTNKMETQT
jgi:hypothetical protein